MAGRLLLWILFPWLLALLVIRVNSGTSSNHSKHECADPLCQTDPLGFEAIIQLHSIIDDDHNGNLDRSESDEYFRDELQHDDGAARQAKFHGSDDLISVHDLWLSWTQSEVYNWTIDDVIFWLDDEVTLPQYTQSFRVNAVDGHILPRLAVNSNYVSSILEIKNGVHRQKLAVKATDLVLFGQKKKGHSLIKDLLLVALFTFAAMVMWLARRQNHKHERYVKRVLGELEVLQKSEDVIKQLQHNYEETKQLHQKTFIEKQHIESKLKSEISEAKNEAERLRTTREATEEEIFGLKLAEQELTEVRKALEDSERCCEQLRREHLLPLLELQQWLQLSYEIETQHYEDKREAAHRHLRIAREMCDRVRKKRSGLLGSLRIAHSTSLDDTDHSIMQAKGALEEVKLHLEERTQRWREIEDICGFDIRENAGLHVLETTLRGIGGTYLAGICGGGGMGSGGMTKSPSVSTFSNVSAMPMDTELDDDVSTTQLQAAPNHRDKRRTLVDSHEARSSAALSGSLKGRPRTSSMGKKDRVSPETTMSNNSSSNNSPTTPPTESGDHSPEANQPVKFGLHDEDDSSDASTVHSGSNSNVTSSYQQSRSVEVKSAPRPTTLTTSQSESSITTSPQSQQQPSALLRNAAKNLESPQENTGSNESLETSSDKKKRKSIKMPEIFKKKKP